MSGNGRNGVSAENVPCRKLEFPYYLVKQVGL